MADALGLKLKDWVSLVLSILAFVVSVGTAYFTLLRQEDNISLVVHGGGFAVRTSEESLSVNAKETANLFFLNSGNRPAAITSVSLAYLQSRLDGTDECPYDGATHLETDFKPLVVKPNEVAIATVKVADGAWYDKDKIRRDGENIIFNVREDNRSKSRFPMEMCATVRLATPSYSRHYRSITFFKYWVEDRGGWSWSFGNEGPQIEKPTVLLKERRTIFWN